MASFPPNHRDELRPLSFPAVVSGSGPLFRLRMRQGCVACDRAGFSGRHGLFLKLS